MIEIRDREQLSAAIERARRSKLSIRPTKLSRQYRCLNRENGQEYTIDFFKRNGKKFGHCTCAAGQRNLVCKHLSAAVGYHMMRMAALKEAQRIASLPDAA